MLKLKVFEHSLNRNFPSPFLRSTEIDVDGNQSSTHGSAAESKSKSVKTPEKTNEILQWLLLDQAYAIGLEQL
jgi:hypothetical protein